MSFQLTIVIKELVKISWPYNVESMATSLLPLPSSFSSKILTKPVAEKLFYKFVSTENIVN